MSNGPRPIFHVDSTGALRHTRPEHAPGPMWAQGVRYGPAFYHFLRSRLTNLVASNPWMIDLAGRFGFRPNLPRTPGVVQSFYERGWQERWRGTILPGG